MKQLISIAALIAAFATGTSAAQAQSSQPTVNWTGFYIGGHGGYQWSTVDLGFERKLPGLGDGVSLDTDGGMGGLHGGIQQQFGNWVLGVELSGDWGNGDGAATGVWTYDSDPKKDCKIWRLCLEADGNSSASVDIDSLFLATGRIGYAWDNLLFFAKGGFASAEIGASINRTGDADYCAIFFCGDVSWDSKGSTEKRHNGFALGGGFDWMIWKSVSFGVDYTYVNLDSETHNGTLNSNLTVCDECEINFTKDYKIKVDPDDIHYVNARLTLHFNGLSP